ncbi:hypothetical protein [Bradyrhizobium canariense]|uniref:hypothetical protein n=1 Tax=Bradyrhizobium canariense TaxID=255045 RepID=UPI001F0B27F9|nr:hypothetical protein [Bradyrhizobium canariense]
MKSNGLPEREIEGVWTAMALHTTRGIPEHMRAMIALVTAGVEMDVLGIAYPDISAFIILGGKHQHQEAAHDVRQREW